MKAAVEWARRKINAKRLAYHRTFLGQDGKPLPYAHEVLKDLRRASGIDKGGIVVSPISCTVDSHASMYRAGQRDMYLRIVKFLGLDGSDVTLEDDKDG